MTQSTQGLLLVYTGDGKGKTTAAFGAAFRALGRDWQVAIVQFIKGTWKTGERLMAERLGLDLEVSGRGFTWVSDDLSRDAAAAERGWARAAALIGAGAHQLVILDELTYALNYGFLDAEAVVAALRARPPHVHVIVTGRHAPQALLEAADLVTDMQAVKHPFRDGVPAQKGLDF